MRGLTSGVAAAAVAVACLMPAGGLTAEDERRETVQTRPRPDLDPLGFRLGSFLLYPALTLGLEFDDNVFRTERDRDADLIARIVPRFRLQSDWNNHALEIAGNVDAGLHAFEEREDYTDAALGLAGRIDVQRATRLFGGAQFEHLHEDRGAPDAQLGAEPTRFNRASANFGISQRFNRLSLTGEGRYVNLNYSDVPAAGGGSINNDDRDRDIYLLALRAGYEILPGFEPFVRGSYNRRDYDARRDDFGIDRDSQGYEMAVGTQIDLTGVTFGEAYVGYRGQAYDDRSLDSITGLAMGARLTANVTPLTTVQLAADRDIEETNLFAAEGFWATSVRASVDHELLRNLILSGGLGYAWYDYRGADRDDDSLRATLAANYLMSRYLTIGIAYDFEWRESHGAAAGTDYTANRILLKITGHP